MPGSHLERQLRARQPLRFHRYSGISEPGGGGESGDDHPLLRSCDDTDNAGHSVERVRRIARGMREGRSAERGTFPAGKNVSLEKVGYKPQSDGTSQEVSFAGYISFSGAPHIIPHFCAGGAGGGCGKPVEYIIAEGAGSERIELFAGHR